MFYNRRIPKTPDDMGHGLFTSGSRYFVGTWIRGREDPEASFIMDDAREALVDRVALSGIVCAIKRFTALNMLDPEWEGGNGRRLRYNVTDSPGWEVFDGSVRMVARMEQLQADE